MAFLKLENVIKNFVSGRSVTRVISSLNLVIEKGQVIAIKGDNGTGKTTLINIIAGIEKSSSGRVIFEHIKNKIGLVPQDYSSSLLPYLNAFENISLPLRLRGEKKKARGKKVYEIIEKLGFSNLPLNKFPHQLSGGQKQKVAISRALISDPDVLILDEPFSNIDTHTQIDLQQQINSIHNNKTLTTIFVSHELDHCIYLADRIVLMHGKPAQISKIFDISLARPRMRKQIFSEEFEKIRFSILKEEDNLYAQIPSI